jgi:6-phospho-beta-glucosidase
MGIVVEALCKYSPLKVIGACDDPYIYTKRLAELLELNPTDLRVDYVGLSQMGWIQDVKSEGRSIMGKVLERLDCERDDGFDCDLIDLFRMIPTRTVSLFFHQDEILKKQKGCARFRAEMLWEAEQQILKLYENEGLAEVPDLTRERNAAWYQETVIPLIEALESDTERETVLCVRNGGAIRDLPEECSVEVPTKVSRLNWEPKSVGNCPRFLKGIFLSVKESDRLTVEAVRHRSYEYALQALTINPLVPSLEAAKKYLERVVKEERIELH